VNPAKHWCPRELDSPNESPRKFLQEQTGGEGEEVVIVPVRQGVKGQRLRGWKKEPSIGAILLSLVQTTGINPGVKKLLGIVKANVFSRRRKELKKPERRLKR